jgi:hypothetical protein
MRRGLLPVMGAEGRRSFFPSRAEGAAMATPARIPGEILHLWLRLLGWQIETGRDGDYTVGVGTHLRTDGSTLRVELAAAPAPTAILRCSCSSRRC